MFFDITSAHGYETGNSVLDDFVRNRLYRKQTAEFQWLAGNASDAIVRRRYRSIARRCSDLASRKEQADKKNG